MEGEGGINTDKEKEILSPPGGQKISSSTLRLGKFSSKDYRDEIYLIKEIFEK